MNASRLGLGANPTNRDYEREIARRVIRLQQVKREQAQRLGKYFANLSLETRKNLLPRITAALFGESSYEIEIIKQAQIYKTMHTATIKSD